jgi:hypothetical protein
MRLQLPLVVLLLVAGAVLGGCNNNSEASLISALNADERTFLGTWEGVPDPSPPGTPDLSAMLGQNGGDAAGILKLSPNRSFVLTCAGMDVTGTWKVKKDEVTLQITKVDGVSASEVLKETTAFSDMAANKQTPSRADMERFIETIGRQMALKTAECYRTLTISKDKTQLTAGKKVIPDAVLLGLGTSFKKATK